MRSSSSSTSGLLMLLLLPLFVTATTSATTTSGGGTTRIHTFRGNMHHIQYHPEDTQTSAVREHYFPHALVDHFTSLSQRRFWRQRYFLNDEFWGGVGFPVFLYIGGEGPVTASVLTRRNYIHFAARQHRAMLIAVEHRFYGKSYPTDNMDLANLRFLSSEQALSDLARLHHFLNEQFQSTRWLAFGGSYPGALAAWMKVKYPKLLVGSIASSAPIRAQSDFREYMQVVGDGYRYFGGGQCYHAIEQAVAAVHALLTQMPGGKQTLQRLFQPCDEMLDEWDESVFEGAIMGYFQDISQYNLLHTNAMTVSQVCAMFTSGKPPLHTLVEFVRLNRKGDCVESKFQGHANATIETLMDSVFDGEKSSRQWFYQTCNEFGYFQNTESERSPFHAFSLLTTARVASEICARVFNISEGPDVLSTNVDYGGLGITAENITFPSGTIDPWHVLAVQNATRLASRRLTSVFIRGTAHCADMYHPSSNDSAALVWAHQQIQHSIESYLGSSADGLPVLASTQ